jgi:hypothetical protein
MAKRGRYFTGFAHLIGETLEVLADGVVHDNVVVDSLGGITLTRDAEEVIAGLKQTPILQPMPIEAGGEDMAAKGEIKRIHRVHFELYKTGKIQCGIDANSVSDIELEDSLFTGAVRHYFDSSPDLQGKVYVTSDKPLPLTILSMTMKGVTYVQ